MKNSSLVCVLRSVAGAFQWVAAAGRTDIVDGETAKVGEFTSFTQKDGPYETDVVTCYEPGRTTDRVMRGCVVRLVGKQQEYVTMAGRFDLVDGEPMITGFVAIDAYVKDGPSGSNQVPVMRFDGERYFGKVSVKGADSSEKIAA